MKLDILFRSCEGVNCYTGPDRIVPKKELILRSFTSLCYSIGYERLRSDRKTRIFLSVIDDHSSDGLLEQLKKVARHFKIDFEIFRMTDSGNGESMQANFEHARDFGESLIYFVEDDYLHRWQAIPEMISAYERISENMGNVPVVLHPTDDPFRYRDCYPSYIFLGEKYHWRQIQKTTCTFFLHRDTLMEHWDRYMDLTQYGKDPTVGEDNTINKVYETVPCFSPIPTLAIHLQYDYTISPFTDWGSLWRKNDPQGVFVENV